METIYIGNTLINDIFLGSQRMDDAFQNRQLGIEFLVVAGGGASGASNGSARIPGSGGGGAGGLKSGSLLLNPSGTSYTIIVGAGGAGRVDNVGFNGNRSVFNLTETSGGGGGGTNGAFGSQNGQNGGSGGGGGYQTGVGGTGISGEGFNGGSTNSSNRAGGGGGAGGAGSSNAISAGSGSIWLDGLEYAIGGPGDGGTGRTGAVYGNGGIGVYNQNFGDAGQNGVVIIRYIGTPQASGGTITQSGGYTYHTYTSVATSSFTY